ncbi:MAG: substrate-binding domain-containing protein [Phycisphaeraceae bacterium]
MRDSLSTKRIAIAIELHWNLPWHLDCYQGIMDYGEERGWKCRLDPYLNGVTGDEALSVYDGIVGRLSKKMAAQASSAGIPTVNLLDVAGGLPTVRTDFRTVVQLACDHLIGCGYRQLGYLPHMQASEKTLDSLEKIFSHTAQTHGLPRPVSIPFQDTDLQDPEHIKYVRIKMSRWIKSQDKPIGLFVYQGQIARYLAQICEQLDVRIPNEVGIVSHDVDVLTATSITPTLSSVDIDCWEWGRQAANVLDQLMQGRSVTPRVKSVSPSRVIVRESSDAFLYEDQAVSRAMRFIADHGRRGTSAEEVAAELRVSRRTLDRRFEDTLGFTVSEAIVSFRMDQIKAILVEGKLTMATIADLFSFGSASQFTQFFKKQVGVTPTNYRKQYQKGI